MSRLATVASKHEPERGQLRSTRITVPRATSSHTQYSQAHSPLFPSKGLLDSPARFLGITSCTVCPDLLALAKAIYKGEPLVKWTTGGGNYSEASWYDHHAFRVFAGVRARSCRLCGRYTGHNPEPSREHRWYSDRGDPKPARDRSRHEYLNVHHGGWRRPFSVLESLRTRISSIRWSTTWSRTCSPA